MVAEFAVMVIHCYMGFGQNSRLCGAFRWGHLYINDYAEFDSKISFIIFLHDYHLACEISTVRTLALGIWHAYVVLDKVNCQCIHQLSVAIKQLYCKCVIKFVSRQLYIGKSVLVGNIIMLV